MCGKGLLLALLAVLLLTFARKGWRGSSLRLMRMRKFSPSEHFFATVRSRLS